MAETFRLRHTPSQQPPRCGFLPALPLRYAGEGVLKLLTPADRVAVNEASGTDAPGGGWAVPMQDVVNKAAIDTMNPVDPMSYKPALTAAYNAPQHTNARIKHIILLGDGDAEDSYSAHVTQIRKAGITISVVATGGATNDFGTDYGTMQNIARCGGGTTGAACVRRLGAK